MTGRLRTLHINTERTFRGGEQQVLLLMQGLVERGHEATLIAQPDGELARRAEKAGLSVHRLRIRAEWDPIALTFLTAKLREMDCDIVHMHTGLAHTLGVAASLLAGRGRRVVSRRVVSPVGRNWLAQFKYRRGVDRYIAISEAVKRTLVDGGVAPERVAVVHSCVDIAGLESVADRAGSFQTEFGIPRGAPVIGSVGALCEPKGFEYFIDAIPVVMKDVPDARFLLVGDGELRGQLEARAADRGIGRDHLVFTGWRNDVPELLRFFDVFVSSSVREGLGTAVLQAMAVGTPVVATDAGGLPEVVLDGETGAVVPAGDAAALGLAIAALLNDAGFRERIRSAAYRRVREEFTPARMVEGTLVVYRDVLGAC